MKYRFRIKNNRLSLAMRGNQNARKNRVRVTATGTAGDQVADFIGRLFAGEIKRRDDPESAD